MGRGKFSFLRPHTSCQEADMGRENRDSVFPAISGIAEKIAGDGRTLSLALGFTFSDAVRKSFCRVNTASSTKGREVFLPALFSFSKSFATINLLENGVRKVILMKKNRKGD